MGRFPSFQVIYFKNHPKSTSQEYRNNTPPVNVVSLQNLSLLVSTSIQWLHRLVVEHEVGETFGGEEPLHAVDLPGNRDTNRS